jgi:hypothetical protein
MFQPTERKAKMKTVYRKTSDKKSGSGPRKSSSSKKLDKDEKQKQIDAILDKISKSGYDSLSKSEKDFLFKAGKED